MTSPDMTTTPTVSVEHRSNYEAMVALYNERTGPMRDARDHYLSWDLVPVAVQSAVIAWDAARRSGSWEAPMSERNALSMAGLMVQALTATSRGIDDAVDDELRSLRTMLAAAAARNEAPASEGDA